MARAGKSHARHAKPQTLTEAHCAGLALIPALRHVGAHWTGGSLALACTGKPKGVVHTYASRLAGGWTTAVAHSLKPQDRRL